MVSAQLPYRTIYLISIFFFFPFFLFSQSITLKSSIENKGKTLFEASFDSSWIDFETHFKSENIKENTNPELKACSLQLTPFPFISISFGSLQSSGLPSKTRNPLFTLNATKAPIALITPKTFIASSSTKPPLSIGIEIQGDDWKTCAEGIIKDGHVYRFWISNEQEYSLLGISKSKIKIGTFCSYFENVSLLSDSWFLNQKEDSEEKTVHTAFDFSIKLNKTTISSSFFIHIPANDIPSPAIRLQGTFPIFWGTFSAGIFSSEIDNLEVYQKNENFYQSSFKDSEGKIPTSSIRGYIGTENLFPILVLSTIRIKLTTCLVYDKKKPLLWYEDGNQQFSAGTCLSFTAFSTTGIIELSNTTGEETTEKERLIAFTAIQILPKWIPGSIATSWKLTNEINHININLTLTPCKFFEFKNKTSVEYKLGHQVSPEETVSLLGKINLKNKGSLQGNIVANISSKTDYPDLTFTIKTIIFL
ncbi:MAG TPA: hypothetical protein VJ861_02965 [Treponemataceae bacterium]|nr:hypothetical protein [Treponemataceae bacterium]